MHMYVQESEEKLSDGVRREQGKGSSRVDMLGWVADRRLGDVVVASGSAVLKWSHRTLYATTSTSDNRTATEVVLRC